MELIFGPEEAHGVSELDQKSPGLPTRVEGAPTPLGAPPYLADSPETPLTCSRCQHLFYIYPNFQKET